MRITSAQELETSQSSQHSRILAPKEEEKNQPQEETHLSKNVFLVLNKCPVLALHWLLWILCCPFL